jgi:hypothetical protein
LSKAGGHRVEPGNGNEDFVFNAAVIAFVVKGEDFPQTYFPVIITHGDVYGDSISDEAVITASQNIKTMLSARFARLAFGASVLLYLVAPALQALDKLASDLLNLPLL